MPITRTPSNSWDPKGISQDPNTDKVYLVIYFSCQSNELSRTFNHWKSNLCVNVTSQPEAADVLERMGAHVRFWLNWESRWDNEKQLEVVTFIFPVSAKTSTTSFHPPFLPPFLIPSQCFVLSHKTARIKWGFRARARFKPPGEESGKGQRRCDSIPLPQSLLYQHAEITALLTKFSVFHTKKCTVER